MIHTETITDKPSPSPIPLVDLDRILEVASDLILVTDAYGMFKRVSKSAHDILGYDSPYMEGRLATDFVYPADLENTRDEMRHARRTGRSRYFACRYIDIHGQVVELVWKGVWLEKEKLHLFIGRRPLRGELPVWIRRLDVMDGFQMSKGLYALSLVLAWYWGIGNNATLEIRRLVDDLNGSVSNWIAFMIVYTLACLLCLFWKQRWFQFTVSIISVIIWIWMGFITLWAPNYAAAAGLYEVMLGFGSICVLYFRGRQL